ncbi:MAG: dihydrofolate reductase [Bacteroidetes bacterium]|nr:dihydrofolate reductase [Bacteroidota bacterium]
MKPVLSLIVAAAEDGAIGHDNRMLWHLPDDFRWFKKHTLGHPMIMGRNTMESIGRALPGRRNLVVSRSMQEGTEGFEYYQSLEAALQAAETTKQAEIFVIGGGNLYQQAIPLAGRIYLTRVQGRFPDASVHFHMPQTGWDCVFSEAHVADEKHLLPFRFEIWERQS